MSTIHQLFIAIIFVLIPIECIYGHCPFCGKGDEAASCKCETELKSILEKMQNPTNTVPPITINPSTGSAGFTLTFEANTTIGLGIFSDGIGHSNLQFKPLCLSPISTTNAFDFGQFLHTCKCIANASDLLIKMLTNISTQNIPNLSTDVEWSIALTTAFSAFTSNPQENIYYWINSNGSDNRWIIIVISQDPQTDSPCFTIMQVTDRNFILHQERSLTAVMALLSATLLNQRINSSGHFTDA